MCIFQKLRILINSKLYAIMYNAAQMTRQHFTRQKKIFDTESYQERAVLQTLSSFSSVIMTNDNESWI